MTNFRPYFLLHIFKKNALARKFIFALLLPEKKAYFLALETKLIKIFCLFVHLCIFDYPFTHIYLCIFLYCYYNLWKWYFVLYTRTLLCTSSFKILINILQILRDVVVLLTIIPVLVPAGVLPKGVFVDRHSVIQGQS